jgi:hypothetical protein
MPDPTLEDFNRALLPECERRGECLCLSPMRLVVNAAGLRCTICGQTVRDFYYSQEAKRIRARVIAAAFPALVKRPDPG